jgi:dihydrofolate reductase
VAIRRFVQLIPGVSSDRRGGFERGGWALPLFDNEAATFLGQVYQRADAFLFGRRTYEIFAGSWGTWDDPGDSPIWTALNTKPKYVASTISETSASRTVQAKGMARAGAGSISRMWSRRHWTPSSLEAERFEEAEHERHDQIEARETLEMIEVR